MKHFICLLTLSLLLVSCSNKRESELYGFQSKQIIDLTDKSICFDYIDRIKRIDVLNLTVDDSWVHLRYPRMVISDRGYYFLSDRTDFLVGYDKSGHLKFSKSIKGRGRGEIISVGNMFMRSDTLMIYDRSAGRVLCFDENGNFLSFYNREEVRAEKYYVTDDCCFGLSIFGDSEYDGHYCVKYDKDGSFLDNYLFLPEHYVGYNSTIGYTDMSYIYHDTLRFILPHDYTVFSMTKNGIESSFRFKADHEIPNDYFDGMTGLERMNPEVFAKMVKEGFTDSFSELTETDRYLAADFSSENKNYMMLYDKRNNTYGLLLRPDALFEESMASELTTQDIWRYILFSFARLCVYDNSIYGCASYGLYYILSKTIPLHDEKIKAFYGQLESFVKTQKIEEGDMFFFKMDLL
ncbi:MAG: 6-bladed beta-propeller [Bacteroidaceae bacterium]|nr:6-bladed beta-propeller [Bacteroidaceae bacterium]